MQYEGLTTLSFEARQKLAMARPASLGQAGRIPGVSPSDLQSLVMEILKQRRSRLDLPLEDPVPD
jgi:tRNA uridine 5-carboxymethylaminomethyl modification enzyme